MENRPLLMTKVMPPVRRSEAVVRTRLHTRIREGADRALTLVAAGPGFGKSTLLTAWREEELSSRSVAWLTLAESENDPVALCAYIVEAIRAAHPGFGRDVQAAPATPGPPLEDALPRLVNDLATAGSLALVLDDFHRVSSRDAQLVVRWLAENSPPGFQLVIATRVDPPLPLASLRAHGDLVELRTSELALTVAEADEFLNARLGLRLSTDEVAALVEKTEGWPAGVYLAALSVRRAPDPHESVRLLSASSRHIVDFLADEVLHREPPELQAFMVRCSFLERLSGPLCDAVLEREGSGETLGSLWASNLFLTALGDRGEWYRFHRLFAEVLRTELERYEPEAVAGLHRRAAAWYREAGDVDSAIGHALAGGAFEDAADLISDTFVSKGNAGKAASTRAWLDQLPAHVPSGRPTLKQAGARLGSSRPHAERGGFMEAIFKRYQNVPDDRFSELVARAWNGDAGGAVASARRLVAHEARESDFWPEACEILGWCLYVNDDLHESTRWLQEARSRALASQQWVIVAVAAAELSLVAGERHQPSEQQHFAGEAYACLVEHGLAKTPGYEGVVHTARGAALAAQGQLGDAREPLEHGLETRPPTRFQVLDAIVPLIPVVRALGDREGAYALLEEAQTVLSDCRDPGGFRRRLAAVARLSGPRSVRYGGQVGDLSTAELRVLELLDAGRSQREIGRELYVSFNTVHGHVKSIYRKLGVGSRQEALAKARSKAPALPRLDRVDRVGRQRS